MRNTNGKGFKDSITNNKIFKSNKSKLFII